MIEHPLSEQMSGGLLSEVLIDGEWIEYYQCADSTKPKSLVAEAVYLGTSKEVRHNGVIQKPWKTAYHFWKKPK